MPAASSLTRPSHTRARRKHGPPVDKYDSRRAELADAALQTLAEMGYAKTSLREIAQNSVFSHGVLHYYFQDKLDLITCSIRQYKSKCATRYDQVVAEARTREELVDGFLDKIEETIRHEAQLHCLWYDLRSQALFEPGFREDVAAIDQKLQDMIWRVVTRYTELGGQTPKVSPGIAYAMLDGLFQKHLLQHISGKAEAIPDLLVQIRGTLPLLA